MMSLISVRHFVQLVGSTTVTEAARKLGLNQRPLSIRKLIFSIDTPDEANFPLEQPISQLSPENNPKPLICDRAVLVCRNDGTWNFDAHLTNEETLADVNFLFEVRLEDLSGLKFGDTIDGALSASGDGPTIQTGLRVKGYPASGTFRHKGNFEAFQNPIFWSSIKGIRAKFRMLAAFGEPTSSDLPEVPDPDE